MSILKKVQTSKIKYLLVEIKIKKNKLYGPFVMNGVQLPQG